MCSNFVEDFTNKIIEKLEKQNKELEGLRYLASQVNYCEICYECLCSDNYYS